MKIKYLSIIILVFLSCGQNQNNINRIASQIEHTEVFKECNCYNGLGEKPIEIFTFSNNNSISVCGYAEKKTVSEFGIFDCKTEKLITGYDATQTCILNFKNDELEIIELTRLPFNDNWEWGNIEVGKEIITIKNNSIISLGQKPLKVTSTISNKIQNQFLDLLKTDKLIDVELEEIIGRLEMLSIIGNERATRALYDIEGNPKFVLDGAIAEQYKDAIANVKWRKEQ